MKLETTRFGEIDVIDEQVYLFNQGIPGFHQYREFALIHAGEDIPFSFLQSMEDPELSFIIANPFLFFADFQFELSSTDQSELHIESEEDVIVFVIVTINDQEEFTVNLLAPVILNKENKRAKQIVLHQSEYRTKHVLLFKHQDQEQTQSTELEADV